MTPERRIIYVDASRMTAADLKAVRTQLANLGNEPVLVLRQRAWVAFLLGSLVGAIATWLVLTYA